MNGVAWSPWGGLLSRLLNLVTTRVVYDDADSAEVEPAESDALEVGRRIGVRCAVPTYEERRRGDV